MSEVCQLLGVTYAVFDITVGPQLKYSYPTNILSEELFANSLSDYVIVAKEFCNRIILVELQEFQYVNYAVAIENPKYVRNALVFAFGFVLPKEIETGPYENALIKLSTAIVDLELESGYLFGEDGSHLPEFLKYLFIELRENNEAFLALNPNNFLTIKIFENPLEPETIFDYSVPILNHRRVNLASLPWDISFQHLIPFLDGTSHVKAIAKMVDMDIDCAKRSLRLLRFNQCVIISDVFKFSNIYKLIVDSAVSILSDPDKMETLREYSAIIPRSTSHMDSDTYPTKKQITDFMFRLQPGKSIRNILLDSLESSRYSALSETPSTSHSTESSQSLDFQNIDITRLLAIAQDFGMIRRVHEYPMFMNNPTIVTDSKLRPLQMQSNQISVSNHYPHVDKGLSTLDASIPSDEMKSASNNSHGQISNHKSFQRLTTKSRSVLSKSYVKYEAPSVNDISVYLNGYEKLDAICCRFELSYRDIADHPQVQLIYK